MTNIAPTNIFNKEGRRIFNNLVSKPMFEKLLNFTYETFIKYLQNDVKEGFISCLQIDEWKSSFVQFKFLGIGMNYINTNFQPIHR